MNDDTFEWDDDKAAENWRRHGVTFVQAARATRDPFAFEWIDEREELRRGAYQPARNVRGVILHITYAERGERTRIISARRATRHEQDHYYRENGP
jgi:uncharacterized protein